jgi:5'-nucleotidase
MRILVTNDDGINAPGLGVLTDIARELSKDVWVVAPETNQSGTSHSLTLHTPLRMRKLDERTYAVTGTPTDCVIMAVRHLLAGQRPTLVLSGINDGANVAEDVTYSGTVAGAMEGTLLGIPSLALSLMTFGVRGDDESGLDGLPSEKTQAPKVHWDTPRKHAPGLIRQLLEVGFPAGTLLNINFPAVPPDAIKGVAITRQGVRDQDSLAIDQRADPWGKPYYWFGFRYRPSTLVEGTDIAALAAGQISVTPLSLDLTNDAVLDKLTSDFQGVTLKRAASA